MQLHTLDWIIAFISVAVCFVPALFFGKRSGKSTAEFFASGRSVPWWLAGISMVATTFSSDTPNLVANFVRNDICHCKVAGSLKSLFQFAKKIEVEVNITIARAIKWTDRSRSFTACGTYLALE